MSPFQKRLLSLFQAAPLFILTSGFLPSELSVKASKSPSAYIFPCFVKLLCTEILQHLWKKKYCVIQLSFSMLSAHQPLYIFLVSHPMWVFMPLSVQTCVSSCLSLVWIRVTAPDSSCTPLPPSYFLLSPNISSSIKSLSISLSLKKGKLSLLQLKWSPFEAHIFSALVQLMKLERNYFGPVRAFKGSFKTAESRFVSFPVQRKSASHGVKDVRSDMYT